MRRLCFDTESSFFIDKRHGNVDVETRRELSNRQPIRFDCGVIYEEETNQYYEFTAQTVVNMIEMLKQADEIISHSGSRHDLIVLNRVCGSELVAPIEKIKHHDLYYICNRRSLNTLTEQYFPSDYAEWEVDYERCYAEADAKSPDNFVPARLVKARHDVKRTYAVYKELLRRGELIVSSDKF
jgi:hypothetical protein